MNYYVPPGGHQGFSQMTPASRVALTPRGSGGGGGGGRRRKRKKATRAVRKRAKAKRGGRKLKFGSPAWRKKYMKK